MNDLVYNVAAHTDWDQYQLTGVSTNGTAVETYAYDPLGRRVQTVSGGVTNCHVYDGLHVVADLDYSGGMMRSYTPGPGVDNWLAMTVHTGTVAQTYYYLTDHLGTVHAFADETGAIVESYRYDAWGNVLAVWDDAGIEIPNQKSAISNRFLFQGREHSFATGLTNFRARWYDPATGRWLSNDPIGISGGLNQYVFCGNDPVDCRDPMGLDAQVIFNSDTDVEIHIPIRFSGRHATAENITIFRNAIENTWSGVYDGINVVVKVVDEYIGVRTNEVECFADRRNSRQSSIPRWNTAVRNPGRVAAHEAGHLMGLKDRYDYATGKPHPGWEQNIMGVHDGRPSTENIRTILRLARLSEHGIVETMGEVMLD